MATTSSVLPTYETLHLSRPVEYVVQVELNRPKKRNAMNGQFWKYWDIMYLVVTNNNDYLSPLKNNSGLLSD